MTSDGVHIEFDELAKMYIAGASKREVTQMLAEEYSRAPEYKKMLDDIKIDLDEVRERVLDKMVDKTIDKWVEERNGR